MHEVDYESDLTAMMSAVDKAMFEWDGHLQYKNGSRGIVVFSPSNWSRFPNATLVVDVAEGDGTCTVRIHGFLSGALVKYEKRMRKYELEFAHLLLQHMTSG
jgi:hypothetical protein